MLNSILALNARMWRLNNNFKIIAMEAPRPAGDEYVPFGPEWESHLKRLPKEFIINLLKEEGLRRQAKELTEKEQKLMAFAMFGLAMKLGRDSFHIFEEIAVKLGATEYLLEYAKDWLNYSKDKNNEANEQQG